ncbi:hypothetical protein MHZ92_06145 [Sporosarcina sp. ACRSL]|uniref:hypothetical protein n=1 Tax=Sporosarcina sp. ACRSL TaxID=2918215 RepID=UPI001EF57437|nr:hypothetical protein [Sporosarcina sp. ACRSL]MCG7343705.1 hypothetical protein [Sporosarcina sp. ACRSL]
MKQIFGILILFLCIVIAYSNFNKTSGRESKEVLQLSNRMLTIGEFGSMDEQKLSYEFSISNKGGKIVQEDSIDIVMSEWLAERKLEDKMTEKTIHVGSIDIKGYIIFDAHNLTKQDIANKRLIDGIKMKDNNDEEIMIYHR